MKTLLHALVIVSFMSMPVIAEAAPASLAIAIEMCGDHHNYAPIELPFAPQPRNQNHCNKACHVGCLRKRRAFEKRNAT